MRRQAGGVANSLVSKLLLKEARCEDLADQQYYLGSGGWLMYQADFGEELCLSRDIKGRAY